jgi:hypothetical protein
MCASKPYFFLYVVTRKRYKFSNRQRILKLIQNTIFVKNLYEHFIFFRKTNNKESKEKKEKEKIQFYHCIFVKLKNIEISVLLKEIVLQKF